MRLRSKRTLRDIIATVEDIFGSSAGIINEGIVQKPDGTFDFEHEGYTEVNWDGQETRREDGERLFYDEDWDIVKESDCELYDPDEEEDQ